MVQKHGNQIQLLEENFKLSSTGVLEKFYISSGRRKEEVKNYWNSQARNQLKPRLRDENGDK
jgi:hypothetical protein